MDIAILHLSDLHIVEQNGSYSQILDNLIDDAQTQCTGFKHIVLVITGDIIDVAQYTSSNMDIALSFFKKLRDKLGEKIVGVEIVPGNHDKKRQVINKTLIDEKKAADSINNISAEEWEYFLVPYKMYLELANDIRELFNKNSPTLKDTSYIDEIDEKCFKIIFINLDTSWASHGGPGDKRQLCIEERRLIELKEEYQKKIKSIEKEYITIATAHHPLNWLREKDEAILSSWLLNPDFLNINIYLCGHTHDRQIKSLFDTYKSYITLVTGIGWAEKTAEEGKEKHRYSIYNLNIRNNSCEIIIRKTQSNGAFDFDNDILLTDEEKEDKHIFLPLYPHRSHARIEIPIYWQNKIKNSYIFLNKQILTDMKKISNIFCEITRRMASFREKDIRDFFIKFELNKKSTGTISKQEIYEKYFYSNVETEEVVYLFSNVKNQKILFDNLLAFLRELCGAVVNEFKTSFTDISDFRFHFRKMYEIKDGKSSLENYLYIAICQSTSDGCSDPPPIRDLNYSKSLVRLAYETKHALVYMHNKDHNSLDLSKNTYDKFITLVPNVTKNSCPVIINKKEISLPYLSASLSVHQGEGNSLLLDILNYMNFDEFIFKFVYDYISQFKINMNSFLQEEVHEAR